MTLRNLFQVFFSCYILLVSTSCFADRPSTIEEFEIISRTVAFNGTSFGEVGPYELIRAVAHAKANIKESLNLSVIDITRSNPDKDGWVHYRFDVVILRPINPQKSSRVILYDVVNRGDERVINRLNEGSLKDFNNNNPGNGFLMKQGVTVVWSGWQGDVPLSGKNFQLGTQFPIATDKDKIIQGTVSAQVVFNHLQSPAIMKLPYPVAEGEQGELTVRPSALQPHHPIQRSSWSFISKQAIKINRPENFDGGAIYDFVYIAKNPIVMGLGFLGVRDLMTWLRSGLPDEKGNLNPLNDLREAPCIYSVSCKFESSPTADSVIAFGNSQSGRFLRDFLYQGFNQNLLGKKVFNGMMIHVAGARRTFTNYRWSQPGRFSKEHEDHFVPGDDFPFTYSTLYDPLSKKNDGLMKSCELSETCPKIIQTDSSLEFWQGRASLVLTNGDGKDIDLPDQVRYYLISSTEHAPELKPKKVMYCSQLTNPVQVKPVLRALFIKMLDWTLNNKLPPPSQYPTVLAKTLVPPLPIDQFEFPNLSKFGLIYTGVHNTLSNDLQTNKKYQLMMPMVDSDGNDLAGIRLPEISVPVATYTGWNLRTENFALNHLCGLEGSSIPFSESELDKSKNQDSRQSLEVRYPGGKEEYLQKLQAAAYKLYDQGFLLESDAKNYAKNKSMWKN